MTDLHEQCQTHNDGLLLAAGGAALMEGGKKNKKNPPENKYRANEVSAGTMTHS